MAVPNERGRQPRQFAAAVAAIDSILAEENEFPDLERERLLTELRVRFLAPA